MKLMKATVLAESSVFIPFHRDLSAPAMSTDMSQVGVALFSSFKYDYLVKWFMTVSRAYIFHNVQFCLVSNFSTAYDFQMCLLLV